MTIVVAEFVIGKKSSERTDILKRPYSIQCMSVYVRERRGVVAAFGSRIPCLIRFAFVRGRYLDSGPFVSSCLCAMCHAEIRVKMYSTAGHTRLCHATRPCVELTPSYVCAQ